MVYKYHISYCILLFITNVFVCESKLDHRVVKQNWIPKFTSKLLQFSDEVLAENEIQNAIENHRKTNKIKNLSKDPTRNEGFRNMCDNIEQRFESIKSSAFSIKHTAELNSPATPNRNVQRCCKNMPVPGSKYEGRLRQSVNKKVLCIGSRNGTAIPKVNTNKFSTVFKNNYIKNPSVLWQYYANIDGDFIEYPDSNNHQCDKNGNTISPLAEDWFAVKMSKAERNLVIVYDIGSSTGTTFTTNGVKFNKVIHDAIKETLQTLTPNDKVNVVGFNGTTYTPTPCSEGLFIANQRNTDMINQFLQTTNTPSGDSNYTVGLKAAYKLLLSEKSLKVNKIINTLDIIMLITDGKATAIDTSELFSMIEDYQKKLSRKIIHLVFSPNTSNNRTKQILTDIAEQHVPDWPSGFNISSIKPGLKHGEKGFAYYMSDLTNFPLDVATKFTATTPETANRNKNFTVIAPVIEDKIGLKMTISVPVVDKTTNNSIIGTAAVDASMATVFTEIEDFILGVHSYAFLLEKRHGKVLLHPKLKDPANTTPDPKGETVFPAIRTLEPDMTEENIDKLLNDINDFGVFTAKIKAGRSTFMMNTAAAPQNVTVFYRTLTGTHFVMIMVMFHSDASLLEYNAIPRNVHISKSPYHRIDKKRDISVCKIDNHIVSNSVTTVKLSPFVFSDSEVYKFTEESVNHATQVSDFLTNLKSTDLIKEDLEEEIWHSLIELQHLTEFWEKTKTKVIERFFGTPFGVFRMFPGVALSNTFDHIQYKWYKKSIASKGDLIFASGKISEFTPKDVVIFTKTIVLEGSVATGLSTDIRGVVGATITHSQLTAALINNVNGCTGNDIECHLLDEQGYFLTHGTADRNKKYNMHITKKFPWLAAKLMQDTYLKPVWCTSMSEGVHQLSYIIQIPEEGASDDNRDNCKAYTIGSVTGTNLFVLAVYNRKNNNCKDIQTCEACGPTYTKCTQCLGTTMFVCQCPCYCDVDFDQCSSQFNDVNSTNFPHQACFYEPLHLELHEKNSVPGPLKSCDMACQSIENEANCTSLPNCEWNSTIPFPLCVQQIPRSTTKKIPNIPTKPNSPTHQVPTKPSHASTHRMPTKPNHTSTQRMPTKPSRSPTHRVPNKPTHSPTHKLPLVPTKRTPVIVITSRLRPTTLASTGGLSSVDHTSSGQSFQSSVTPYTPVVKESQKERDNNVGLIVGLVLAILVVIILVTFIVLRFWGKKIQRALGKTTAGKYVRRNSVVDRMMFSKMNEEVVMSRPPNASVPYGQMT